MTIVEAAAEVLGQEGGALHVRQILKCILDRGLYCFDTPDPAGVLARKIREQTVQDHRCLSPAFSKVAPNTFALSSWAYGQDGADDAFQDDVNSMAAMVEARQVPRPPPSIVRSERRTWYRDPSVSAAALRSARHRCENACTAQLFRRQDSENPYLEAHHLVPMSCQDRFEVSLDVASNVVALCPLCHALVHHGANSLRAPVLQRLFETRRVLLAEMDIVVAERELLSLYEFGID